MLKKRKENKDCIGDQQQTINKMCLKVQKDKRFFAATKTVATCSPLCGSCFQWLQDIIEVLCTEVGELFHVLDLEFLDSDY